MKHTPTRRRFEATRQGLTTKGKVGEHEFYVITNFYDQTAIPGETFITIAKEGSTLGGMMETLAMTISIALQYGVPWEVLSDKYKHSRFEPWDEKSPSLVHRIAEIIDEQVLDRKNVWSDNNEPPSEVRRDEGGDTTTNSEHHNGDVQKLEDGKSDQPE